MRAVIDFETRSSVSVKKLGPWAYAEHPDTDVLCMALRKESGMKGIWINPKVFRPEFTPALAPAYCSNDPARFFQIIEQSGHVEAHNAEFERAIWRKIMISRYGWSDIENGKWCCSAAKAAAFALPRSLEGVGAALHLSEQKDMEGSKIMRKLHDSRAPFLWEDPAEGPYWNEDPDDLLRLFRYCLQDVESEAAVSTELPDLTLTERKIWQLDQRINERGVQVDLEHCHNIIGLVKEYETELLKEVSQLTDGQIQSVRQVAAMADFCGLENMTKATVSEALHKDLPAPVKRLLVIRQALGLSSVSKYSAVIARACQDGRLRSTIMYHGATTGRWTGKGVQLQNLPRKGIEAEYIRLAMDLVRSGDMVWIENLFGGVMALAQALIRPTFRAKPGYELICADFSSIEARVLLWLADEFAGIELFRNGADLYIEMARDIYEREITKKGNPTERQVGKTAILGLGYGMGAPKFKFTCKNNAGIDIEKKFARKVVKTYRQKFPGVPSLWYATERAALAAMQSGEEVECGKVTWFKRDRFLHCRLPSGRLLSYPFPEVAIEPAFIFPAVDDEGKNTNIMIVGDRKTALKRAKKRALDEDLRLVGDPIEKEKSVLSHMGMSDGKWIREKTYGGKLVENIDQAISRDLMAEAMLRLEDAGYPVVMTVHDESVSEVPKGFGSVEEYESIMAQVPAWGEGIPVAAEGWRGERYRK